MTHFDNPEICKPNTAAELREIMEGKPALVVSRQGCQFTPKMVEVLARHNIPYSELLLDQTYPPQRTIDFANCIFNQDPRKVPFLIFQGKNIGTYDAVLQSESKGRFDNGA